MSISLNCNMGIFQKNNVMTVLKQLLEQILQKQEIYYKNNRKIISDFISQQEKMESQIRSMAEEITKLQEDVVVYKAKFDSQEVNVRKFSENTTQKVFNEWIENCKQDIKESIFLDTKTLIKDTLESAKNYMTNQVSANVSKQIKKEIQDDVKAMVRQSMYDEYLKRGITSPKKPIPQEAQVKSEKQSDIYIKLPETQEIADSQQGNIITKIDTNAIRKRILEAVENKNKIIAERKAGMLGGKENSTHECNNYSPVDEISITEASQSVKNIITQSKLGIYKLPCFFDGEKIFGIYNPDHHTQIIHAGMNEDIMVESPAYLQKIHIWPNCEHIAALPNNSLATTTNECEIHYTKGGKIHTLHTDLPVCECCLVGVYRESNCNKTLEEFITDFMDGKVH